MSGRRGSRRALQSGRAGILVTDKPRGVTSFDVVRTVRRKFGGLKAGHTGTLDPLATGVLPICLGDATRVASLLLADDKTYEATAQLGLVTDTLDITGARLSEADISGVCRAEVEQALEGFVGRQQQAPPAFSAVRVGGRRAYELARRGEALELSPREVVIHQLSLSSWEPPYVQLRVHCSKGTYIRSLVADLGQQLGCGATVAALRRVQSGCFTLSHCIELSALERLHPDEVPLLSIDEVLDHLPVVQVDDLGARAVAQGQQGVRCTVADADLVRVRLGEELIGLAQVRDAHLLPRRVFRRVQSE